MKYLTNSITLLLLISIYANEKLNYSVSFRGMNVGTAELMIDEKGTNSVSYNIKSQIKSNKYISYIYDLNDKVNIWVNANDFSLIKVEKNIKEGTYRRDYYAEIINDTIIFNTDRIKINGPLYDPISIIYLLRNKNIELNEAFNITTFDINVIRPVKLTLTNIEKVEVPYGEFSCNVFRPSSIDGSPLFKADGLMTVWLSNDSLKLPIKISQETNLGDMTMKLIGRVEN
tara:strand:+ start:137 stop:823 length:687 start_codon:yes stop_codon:yes gene_type:complete